MNKKIAFTGVLFIIFSIILGAFGAHGLKNLVNAEKIVSFETGVKYQMYQGLAFLIIGLHFQKIKDRLNLFYILGTIGILFFSLSIYILTVSDLWNIPKTPFIPLTPIGGVLLIISWIIFGIKLLKIKD